MNNFSRVFTKNINQAVQFASEKFGTAEDITDLPPEYKELELRVDALRTIHEDLLRVTRIHTNPSYDYPGQLQESVKELTRSVGDQFKILTSPPNERVAETRTAETLPPQQPKTYHHALARTSEHGAKYLGSEDPLGAALNKYATVQERIGDHRIKMDSEIAQKFVQPFNTTLNTNIQFAMRARRNVNSTRLALDSAKRRCKTVRGERSEAVRLEVEQAEDQFVAAVEEATTLMKSVLETPEALRNLSDLVSAQLAFYKEAYEILAEIAPEIDEMQVTQESMLKSKSYPVTNYGLFEKCITLRGQIKCSEFPSEANGDCTMEGFCEEWLKARYNMILAAVFGGLNLVYCIFILISRKFHHEHAWKVVFGLTLLYSLLQLISVETVDELSSKFIGGVETDFSYYLADYSYIMNFLLACLLFVVGLTYQPSYERIN
ncbi:18056_t:CDS:2 [Funneliformis geosporum]|uniref:17475_t:CDS:1 n=1 Tax=Funneliformis geosporum TaxID=1117311 RepID=A0A9W4WPS1_9GLOM|nr:18056_t:CDS:2 [Funneliformis geosporum]CAI2169775.1 17475_t:CDS:2 [Funneliformis geosporum]